MSTNKSEIYDDLNKSKLDSNAASMNTKKSKDANIENQGRKEKKIIKKKTDGNVKDITDPVDMLFK